MTYDEKAGLDICDTCGQYIIDGYCDCSWEPDWPAMVEIAKKDLAKGYYPKFKTLRELLKMKGFPQGIIDSTL